MDEKEKTGKKDPDNRAFNFFALRAAVAAYLCYLGFDLVRGHLTGASTLSAAVSWGCGLGFVAVGLGFAFYSWRRYRRETAPGDGETAPGDGETGKTPDEE